MIEEESVREEEGARREEEGGRWKGARYEKRRGCEERRTRAGERKHASLAKVR
jgi:hypothetical protein